MSTNDIKKMNETITTINTSMATSKNGIKISRYENAIGKLASKTKQHATMLKSFDNRLKEVESDLDKAFDRLDELSELVKNVSTTESQSIDTSKFLSADYAVTITDMLKSLEDIWNVLEEQSDPESTSAIDQLLTEEQESTNTRRSR